MSSEMWRPHCYIKWKISKSILSIFRLSSVQREPLEILSQHAESEEIEMPAKIFIKIIVNFGLSKSVIWVLLSKTIETKKKHFCSLAQDHCQVCESQICAKRFAKVHLASESDVGGGETKTLCKRNRSCSRKWYRKLLWFCEKHAFIFSTMP